MFIIVGGGQMEFCPEDMNQTSNINSSTNATSDDVNDDIEKFTDIAKNITFFSVCFEIGLGYFTFYCFLIKLHVQQKVSPLHLYVVGLQGTDWACFAFTLNHI